MTDSLREALYTDENSDLWNASRRLGWALTDLYPGRLDTGEAHRIVDKIAESVVGIVRAVDESRDE